MLNSISSNNVINPMWFHLPGASIFQCTSLKNWEWPGDEAKVDYHYNNRLSSTFHYECVDGTDLYKGLGMVGRSLGTSPFGCLCMYFNYSFAWNSILDVGNPNAHQNPIPIRYMYVQNLSDIAWCQVQQMQDYCCKRKMDQVRLNEEVSEWIVKLFKE